MKHPTEFPSSDFSALGSLLSPGEFCRFDDPTTLPLELSRIAGLPDTSDYRTTVFMRSSSSEHPPSIGGITPASTAPVYRACVIRTDQHGTTGQLHFNQDEVLLFGDTAGRVWRLYAADQPNHYVALSNDSGLDAALNAYNLPRQLRGPLSLLRDQGARADFSTGEPSS